MAAACVLSMPETFAYFFFYIQSVCTNTIKAIVSGLASTGHTSVHTDKRAHTGTVRTVRTYVQIKVVATTTTIVRQPKNALNKKEGARVYDVLCCVCGMVWCAAMVNGANSKNRSGEYTM